MSRVNAYVGGPTLDIQQVRLRNLTVAIFDLAGFKKPLRNVPMLLIGGLNAWKEAFSEMGLRMPRVEVEGTESRRSGGSGKMAKEAPVLPPLKNFTGDLDLESESKWLESIQRETYLPREALTVSSSAEEPNDDTKRLNRTTTISPTNDTYNKTLLDFVPPPKYIPLTISSKNSPPWNQNPCPVNPSPALFPPSPCPPRAVQAP
jgi:ubiquitin carboxyl-terminal hydrolase 8